MSIENAILAHAAALDKLAAALHLAFSGGFGPLRTGAEKVAASLEPADPLDAKAAELATTTEKRAAVTKAAAAKDAQRNAARAADAELGKAVTKVEDDAAQSPGRKAINDALAAAKAEKDHSPADEGALEKGAEDDGLDTPLDTPLDYAKDVRPVLLAAIKKAGKDKVQALINTFGVDKADKIDPAKHGELLAGAQKLAA